MLQSKTVVHVWFSSHPDAEQILPFEAELSPQARLKTGAKGEEISVLITAAEDRLGGVIAAINSVHHNSKANVAFTIVTPNDTVDHLKSVLNNSVSTGIL